MKAHTIMKKQVIKVKEHDQMQCVIEKFLDYGVSGVPVVNDRNEIVGYVSVEDIMRFIGKPNDLVFGTPFFMEHYQINEEDFVERAQKIKKLNVMEFAQTKVYKVSWYEDIETITAIFAKEKTKKILVERNGVLVGIISRNDVIYNSFKSLASPKWDGDVLPRACCFD
ncbi:CBS domain-containing protein [Niallia sp. Krafla_26]|uniref:CBS domain-containing protein n=1 Tax=Niallia sp. Krafla_26 TaxID=3064703 RepID=UPI003D172363